MEISGSTAQHLDAGCATCLLVGKFASYTLHVTYISIRPAPESLFYVWPTPRYELPVGAAHVGGDLLLSSARVSTIREWPCTCVVDVTCGNVSLVADAASLAGEASTALCAADIACLPRQRRRP